MADYAESLNVITKLFAKWRDYQNRKQMEAFKNDPEVIKELEQHRKDYLASLERMAATERRVRELVAARKGHTTSSVDGSTGTVRKFFNKLTGK